MAADTNLCFIREKIYKIRSAIMYTMSNELVKLPNNVVTAVRVDDEGQLWFLSKRPMQFVSECEQVFPARLKFYRKGISYAIEVSGKATIMHHEGYPEMNADHSNALEEKEVLIKMNMANVEYVDHGERKKSRLDTLLEMSYRWVLKHISLHRHPKPMLAKLHQQSI